MFVYLRFWSRFFARRERIPLMKSDSCAALGAHRKLSSPVPALNHLGAETSLMLESLDMADPEASHLPGKLNDVADYLSRLSAPEVPPKPMELGGLKVRILAGEDVLRFVLPTATERPDLWVARPDEGEESQRDEIR